MSYIVKGKAKKDDNHDDVRQVFIDCGYNVIDTYALNCGFDFFAWGVRGVFVVEVKDGSKPPSATRLTEKEKEAEKKYGQFYRVIFTRLQAIYILTE